IIADTYAFTREHWPDDVCFEANGFQELLAGDYDDFVERHGNLAMPVSTVEHHSIPKIIRIRRLGKYWKRRQIKLRIRSKSNATLLSQCKAFPMGDHDDGPDALEGAIRRLEWLARDAMNLLD